MAPSPGPFDPDARQARALEHDAGAMLMEGGAGTGKTRTLFERFLRLIASGADADRVALVVGSRRARDDARSWIVPRLESSIAGLHIVTVHGLAFRVVDAGYRALGYDAAPRVLSANEQFAMVADLLAGEDPDEWPSYGGMLRLRGFADQVRGFLLRAQESRMRPDEIRARADSHRLPGWNELARFYARYLDVVDDQRAVDFAGLIEQAAAAAEAAEPAFDHVLVDDYQDSTMTAEALLQALRPASLVVAGNLDAHVFAFQGFTDTPMRRFAETFPSSTRVELITPHRAAHPTLSAFTAPHSSEEHAFVARELRRLHVDDGVPWDDLAVVVRREASHAAALVRALDDAGIPRTSLAGGRSLLVEPAAAPYVLALRWAARPAERDGLVEGLLTSELAGCSPAEARTLVRAARSAGRPPGAALAYAEAIPEARADGVVALHDALARVEEIADSSVADAFRVLWKTLPCSARLVADAEAGSEEARSDLQAVLALADATERAGAGPDGSTAAFLDELEAGEEGPGGAVDEHGSGVHVLTAHACAGREFDSVFVVGAVEGNFPSVSRPEPMFDLAVLRGPIPQYERNRSRLEEERRLFRLVEARARRRVTYTASDERDAESSVTARSRFVAERGVSWTRASIDVSDPPLTVPEAHAGWRRILADARRDAAARLAALDGLVAIGASPDRWWYQRDWTDTGRPLREDVRVSASKLDTLDNCELQFVLGEELGLDTSVGYHAWVGHLVHRIIEECEAGVLERDLDTLVSVARERWRREQFPSMAVSERFLWLVTHRMLPRWFEEYGSEPALEAERRFEFELDGATVAGVIDRIGRVEPAGSQITDYKTGKRKRLPPEDILQLRVYFLAVHEAEELRQYLPVRAVELAYVRDLEFHDGVIARTSLAFRGDDAADYARTSRDRLSELIGRVRSLYDGGEIRPNAYANCRYCTFQPLCPLFPEGSDPFPVTAGADAETR
jgi:superfamily I DNA/RNA helicase/RecB family exonuclease